MHFQLEYPFMGTPPARTSPAINHFQTYRNEAIPRMKMPRYEWGGVDCPYTPSPDHRYYKATNKYLDLPPSEFSMIDRGRQNEVDDFYTVCQLHRDCYRDQTGTLHPLDYFKTPEYDYQCPTDPTTNYLKCPEYHVRYKQPIVLPLTLEKSMGVPELPQRALTGVYDKTSDMRYKP